RRRRFAPSRKTSSNTTYAYPALLSSILLGFAFDRRELPGNDVHTGPPGTRQARTGGRPRGTCSSGARWSRCVLGRTGEPPAHDLRRSVESSLATPVEV